MHHGLLLGAPFTLATAIGRILSTTWSRRGDSWTLGRPNLFCGKPRYSSPSFGSQPELYMTVQWLECPRPFFLHHFDTWNVDLLGLKEQSDDLGWTVMPDVDARLIHSAMSMQDNRERLILTCVGQTDGTASSNCIHVEAVAFHLSVPRPIPWKEHAGSSNHPIPIQITVCKSACK